MKKYHIYELDLKVLNISVFVLFFLVAAISLLFCGDFFSESIDHVFVIDGCRVVIFFILYMLYMGLHEVFHGIGYLITGAKWKNISFGIALEKSVLYCLCKQNISKKSILISLYFPFIFIGIITYFISIYYNLYFLFWLSILNITGCVGDIAMFNFIIKLKDIEFSEMDNPTRFSLYSSEDLSKKGGFGLKYIESVDTISREDKGKIKVSKASWYYIIGSTILCLILFLLNGNF